MKLTNVFFYLINDCFFIDGICVCICSMYVHACVFVCMSVCMCVCDFFNAINYFLDEQWHVEEVCVV